MQTSWTAHGRTVQRALPDDLVKQFERLPKRLQYLVDYGWKQSTADAFASAKNADEFEGKLDARIKKILAGEMVIRDGVGRITDPVEREIKRITEERLAAWFRERKAAGKPKPSTDLQETWLNMLHTKRGDEIRAQAEAVVAAKKSDVSGLDDLLNEVEEEKDEEEKDE